MSSNLGIGRNNSPECHVQNGRSDDGWSACGRLVIAITRIAQGRLRSPVVDEACLLPRCRRCALADAVDRTHSFGLHDRRRSLSAPQKAHNARSARRPRWRRPNLAGKLGGDASSLRSRKPAPVAAGASKEAAHVEESTVVAAYAPIAFGRDRGTPRRRSCKTLPRSGNVRERIRNLPRPSRTFELGRVAPAPERFAGPAARGGVDTASSVTPTPPLNGRAAVRECTQSPA